MFGRQPLQTKSLRAAGVVNADLINALRQGNHQRATQVALIGPQAPRQHPMTAIRHDGIDIENIQITTVEHQSGVLRVEPLKLQNGMAPQGLRCHVGVQIETQVAHAHLLIFGIAVWITADRYFEIWRRHQTGGRLIRPTGHQQCRCGQQQQQQQLTGNKHGSVLKAHRRPPHWCGCELRAAVQ